MCCRDPSNKALKLESLPGDTVIWQRVSNGFAGIDLFASICQCWGDITTMRLFNIWLLVCSWRIHVPSSASLDHIGSSMNKRRDSRRNRFTFLQQDTYQNWQACNTEAAHAPHNIYFSTEKKLEHKWDINVVNSGCEPTVLSHWSNPHSSGQIHWTQWGCFTSTECRASENSLLNYCVLEILIHMGKRVCKILPKFYCQKSSVVWAFFSC